MRKAQDKINIVQELISSEDIKRLEEIAKKYNMSIIELGRVLAKSGNNKGFIFNVRFAADEIECIDKVAAEHGVSRAKFCELACKWYSSVYGYDKVDLTSLRRFREDGMKRDIRVNVNFRNKETYISLKEFSNSLSVDISAVIRYCALQYDGQTDF